MFPVLAEKILAWSDVPYLRNGSDSASFFSWKSGFEKTKNFLFF
jgi:hypothetical protein